MFELFRNLAIQRKLLAAFGLVLGLVLLLGILSYQVVTRLSDISQESVVTSNLFDASTRVRYRAVELKSIQFELSATADEKLIKQASDTQNELAEQVGMSGSSLHQHFQAITAISPLQFQKRLRLNEARKLMLTDRMDAASAAFRVCYESRSQFNREYRRQFGSPPLQDIKKIQETIST